MSKPSKKVSPPVELEPDDGVVRSIRFTTSQFEAISAKAKTKKLQFASFVRAAAVNAAGAGGPEVRRLKTLATTLASVGRT